jgi:CO dehydrogenase/acetyl-CoA synthase alpha subunit
MSVGNNIIDASRDLIISVGHNITYLSIISYTVYNYPNTEKYRVNKIHIVRGEAEHDMNIIDPIFSVLGQLYTVVNLS